VRDLRHIAPEVVELRGARDVHDDGMIRGPTLDREEPTQRLRVGRVGTESVDGLGRERHEPTGPQHLGRVQDRVVDRVHYGAITSN